MRILLVEPDYYTRYPPLGLLKLSAYHKARRDEVHLVRGCRPAPWVPDRVHITSLFTFAWEPVHRAVLYFRAHYPRAHIRVGGVYASLFPAALEACGADKVIVGTSVELDTLRPDYTLAPGWPASILFASRGCVRACSYCAVPVIEPEFRSLPTIRPLVDPSHKRVVLWDNNILASASWQDVFSELAEIALPVDFNQGLDARLLTGEVADWVRRLRVDPVRLAYDRPAAQKAVRRAIELLACAGVKKRRIIVYVLYNFRDTPEQFRSRVADLLEWGAVAYPMRYEPLRAGQKNKYVAPSWTTEELEMVAKARRVIGYGGTFPPYEGLRRKVTEAPDFETAFGLREPRRPLRQRALPL